MDLTTKHFVDSLLMLTKAGKIQWENDGDGHFWCEVENDDTADVYGIRLTTLTINGVKMDTGEEDFAELYSVVADQEFQRCYSTLSRLCNEVLTGDSEELSLSTVSEDNLHGS